MTVKTLNLNQSTLNGTNKKRAVLLPYGCGITRFSCVLPLCITRVFPVYYMRIFICSDTFLHSLEVPEILHSLELACLRCFFVRSTPSVLALPLPLQVTLAPVSASLFAPISNALHCALEPPYCTVRNPAHRLNALSPIYVTPLPIVTFEIHPHPSNACPSITPW